MDQGGQGQTSGVAPAKSRRELAWERFLLRVLSLDSGMYTITLAIDDRDGILLGSVENRGKVERWG